MKVEIEGEIYEVMPGDDFTSMLEGIKANQEKISLLIQMKDELKGSKMKSIVSDVDSRLKQAIFNMRSRISMLGENYVQIP